MTPVRWAALKQFVDNKGLSIQWVEDEENYYLFAVHGGIVLSATLNKGNLNEDLAAFEATYRALGNKSLEGQKDSDGAVLSRVKQAPTGWTYQMRGFEFLTASLTSVFNKDPSGNALTDVTLKLYDAAGSLIVDAVNQGSAVKTVVDIEPTYDYYIIGGQAKIAATPLSDMRLSVVAVPDVPAAYGGSKVMIQNVNFRFVTAGDRINADGRAAKWLQYSPIYHSNKLRFIAVHAAGEQHGISVWLEYYKP